MPSSLSCLLLEVENTRNALKKIDIVPRGETIGMGSLVRTETARYFLSISAGSHKEGEVVVYCISGASPMAQLLLGKRVGDVFEFNGQSHTILEVL